MAINIWKKIFGGSKQGKRGEKAHHGSTSEARCDMQAKHETKPRFVPRKPPARRGLGQLQMRSLLFEESSDRIALTQSTTDSLAFIDRPTLPRELQREMDHVREFYEQAADQVHEVAMNNLADLYQRGHGVGQSHVKARDWAERAAAGGFVHA